MDEVFSYISLTMKRSIVVLARFIEYRLGLLLRYFLDKLFL